MICPFGLHGDVPTPPGQPHQIKTTRLRDLCTPTEISRTGGFDLRTPTEISRTGVFDLRTPTEISRTGVFDLRTPTEISRTGGFDHRTPTEIYRTGGFDLMRLPCLHPRLDSVCTFTGVTNKLLDPYEYEQRISCMHHVGHDGM